MYKFSAPMPYSKDDIQKLLNINNHVEKSRITSLYACVPRGCEVFTGFEQSRNFAFNNTSWDYWKRLINQTFDYGCDFIYLLNNPNPLNIENSDFPQKLEKLEFLLSELRKIGVKKLRIASNQLMTYIAKYYKDFDVLASTSLEYKTIWEYQNFIAFQPYVKQIVPSHDVNKNFFLLKNLRKRYPKVELELMVNEGCMGGCPNRMQHGLTEIDKNTIINNEICLSANYFISYCAQVTNLFPIASLVIGNVIFPWDIEQYSKIGIKNFKFIGRDGYIDNIDRCIEGFEIYLKGIDDIRSISNYSIASFIHHLNKNAILNSLSVKDYRKFMPDVKYFQKYGHLCVSRCAIDCRYCYKCAEKIKKVFEKKQKKLRERNIPFCVISK